MESKDKKTPPKFTGLMAVVTIIGAIMLIRGIYIAVWTIGTGLHDVTVAAIVLAIFGAVLLFFSLGGYIIETIDYKQYCKNPDEYNATLEKRREILKQKELEAQEKEWKESQLPEWQRENKNKHKEGIIALIIVAVILIPFWIKWPKFALIAMGLMALCFIPIFFTSYKSQEDLDRAKQFYQNEEDNRNRKLYNNYNVSVKPHTA